MSAFIVIDGIDGAGKTTVSQRLVDHLELGRRPVKYFRDPGSSPYAERLREFLLDPAFPFTTDQQIMLFTACRRQLALDIESFLKADRAVAVVDRWIYSTYVYQGREAKDRHIIAHTHAHMVALHVPDPTIFVLDIPVDVAKARRSGSGKPDRFESAQWAEWERRRSEYLALAQMNPDAHVIDATAPVEDVLATIVHRLYSRTSRDFDHG